MKTLRRTLMQPRDNIKAIYIAKLSDLDISIDEVCERGIRRIRPANANGEELRDVVLWLWAKAYSAAAPEPVVFISADLAFWDKEDVHSQIQKDIAATSDKLSIEPSIDAFLKHHAPAPTSVSVAWASEYVTLKLVEGELLREAQKQIQATVQGVVQNLTIETKTFTAGTLYNITEHTKFAEVEYALIFSFENVISMGRESEQLGRFGLGNISLSSLLNPPASLFDTLRMGSLFNTPPMGSLESTQPLRRRLQCNAKARLAVRVKKGTPTEIALSGLLVDRWKLYADSMKQ
jgi:hypothetical protein